MFRFKSFLAVTALIAAIALAGACGDDDDEGEEPTPSGAGLTGQLEVFSWWTTGGEAAGLEALFDLADANPHPRVDVAVVAHRRLELSVS